MLQGDDPMILDSYERQRRAVAHDDIVQQADTNRARMNTLDPIERAAHLKNLQDIAADPVKARAFLRKSSMIDGLEHAKAIV